MKWTERQRGAEGGDEAIEQVQGPRFGAVAHPMHKPHQRRRSLALAE